jgi:hypothetical protein
MPSLKSITWKKSPMPSFKGLVCSKCKTWLGETPKECPDICPNCGRDIKASAENVELVSPLYEHLGTEIGQLVDEKQKAYGDSFNRAGDIMRSLYPNGISPDQYDDALAIIRIVDKLFRVATHGGKDPMKESPGKDIAGYGLLMARRHEREEG